MGGTVVVVASSRHGASQQLEPDPESAIVVVRSANNSLARRANASAFLIVQGVVV